MPYDPRMQQLTRMGIGMLGPQAGPFDRTQQPRQWWEQPPPSPQQRPDDSNPSGQPATQPPNTAKPPPSLYDMMLSVGRMTRPQYDQAARLGPLGFLGTLAGYSQDKYR
jgi:hypothetical protein